MRGQAKKKVAMILTIVIFVIVAIAIYFNIPYSRLRNEFKKYMDLCHEESYKAEEQKIFDLESMPEPLQKFYQFTGLDKEMYSYHVGFYFKEADFLNSTSNKYMKIKYDEHIYGKAPSHLAFIDSSMYGIPFQGLDSYVDGDGRMKGVIAKNFTIFNIDGESMDKSALVTWLAETIFMPTEFLSGRISLEEIGDNSIKASIENKGIIVSGVFHFDNEGRLIRFDTEDRAYTKNDGTMEYTSWSAYFDDYQKKGDYMLPDNLKAVWHFADADQKYFDGHNIKYTFYK